METCPFYADTLVVSDIHLGWQYSRWTECATLINCFFGKRLLLLGDVFHSPWRRAIDQRHRPFVEAVNEAAQRGVEIVFVIGNHDPKASRLKTWFPRANICAHFSWTLKEKVFRAWHGHQFNGHNSSIWRLGDFLKEVPDHLLHFIQRLEGRRHRISRFLRSFTELLIGLNSSMFRGALKAIRRRSLVADVVLCGHSHYPEKREIEDILFVNPGCWVGHDDGMLGYAVIDDLGRVELRRYAA